MNTDEAIETVVAIARQIVVLNDSISKEIDITPIWCSVDAPPNTKLTEAIKIVEGLKPSNIINEVFDKEMNTRKKRLQLCGKHEDPKDYVPFPDEVEGIVHPD